MLFMPQPGTSLTPGIPDPDTDQWMDLGTRHIQHRQPERRHPDGVVYLSGSLDQETPGSSSFATLPTAYRPKHNLYLPRTQR